jgi:hypothetical protein
MTQSKLDEFSDEQAITGDAISENILDMGPGDVGPGEPLDIVAWVTEDFTLLTSLKIILETHTTEDFSSTRTVLYQTGEVLLADLVEGYEFKLSTLPEGCLRYLALRYDVTGTNPDAGAISARLALDRQANDPNFS